MWDWILVGMGFVCSVTVLARVLRRARSKVTKGTKQIAKTKGLVK